MDNDAGDSLLKLQPPTAPSTLLTISDYFTPYDVFSWDSNGLCPNDEDFGSGGVLLPPNFFYKNTSNCSGSGCSVAITADKQSNLYVMEQAYLGKANLGSSCSGSTNDIQCVTTPPITNDPDQGYWASPAYWFDGTYYWLYYSATMNGTAFNCPPDYKTPCMSGFGPPGISPQALNSYQLQTSGNPISQTPYANSGTANAQTYPILFCDYAPTPSVSSKGSMAGSGIVWAIEQDQNNDNLPNHSPQDCSPAVNGSGGHPRGNPAALHAFNATTMAEIYSSRTLSFANQPGPANAFPTPTIFNSQVYVGTNTEVDVFGLCVNGINGKCKQ